MRGLEILYKADLAFTEVPDYYNYTSTFHVSQYSKTLTLKNSSTPNHPPPPKKNLSTCCLQVIWQKKKFKNVLVMFLQTITKKSTNSNELNSRTKLVWLVNQSFRFRSTNSLKRSICSQIGHCYCSNQYSKRAGADVKITVNNCYISIRSSHTKLSFISRRFAIWCTKSYKSLLWCFHCKEK